MLGCALIKERRKEIQKNEIQKLHVATQVNLKPNCSENPARQHAARLQSYKHAEITFIWTCRFTALLKLD